MGGKGGGSLTMPPLTATMMGLLMAELLAPEDLENIQGGGVIERLLPGDPARPFTMTARLESGRPKIVVRRGAPRARGPGAPVEPHPPVPAIPAEPPRPVVSVEAAPVQHDGLTEAIARALDSALAMSASDLILSTGRAPLAKRAGRVEALGGGPISEVDLRAL